MKMIDGLWVVQFESSLGLFGRGVMVLNGHRLLGGDMGYYYSGQCTVDADRISGEVEIVRFDPNSVSVFGDIESLTLLFNGKISEDSFEADASCKTFPNIVMKIAGWKKANL